MNEIEKFNTILIAFKIKATCISYEKIRNISLYNLKLQAGTRIQTLQKFAEEIALALRANSKLIFKSIINAGIVRVEVINNGDNKISLLNELKNKVIPKYKLPLLLGNSIDGNDIWTDLSKNPHILIGGTTGSGKSVLLHTIITNLLLLSKSKIFVIDTKGLEFYPYTLKFTNISIFTAYSDACDIIQFLIDKMEYRYSAMRGVKYNSYVFTPYILIIDEFADLIMHDKEDILYSLICRLIQKSRAANIYCVIATQRPSADIIRGSIKANLPTRIAFKVNSKVSSRVILDQNGAELLSGNGDAIISNYDNNFVRFQAAFTNPKELNGEVL